MRTIIFLAAAQCSAVVWAALRGSGQRVERQVARTVKANTERICTFVAFTACGEINNLATDSSCAHFVKGSGQKFRGVTLFRGVPREDVEDSQ